MTKYALLFIAFLFIFTSCKKNEIEKPENLISQDEMVSILMQIHVIEAYVDEKKLDKAVAQQLFKDYQSELFADYQIDSTVFAKSYDYYKSEGVSIIDIYNRVVDSLNIKKGKGTVRAPKAPKTDSDSSIVSGVKLLKPAQ